MSNHNKTDHDQNLYDVVNVFFSDPRFSFAQYNSDLLKCCLYEVYNIKTLYSRLVKIGFSIELLRYKEISHQWDFYGLTQINGRFVIVKSNEPEELYYVDPEDNKQWRSHRDNIDPNHLFIILSSQHEKHLKNKSYLSKCLSHKKLFKHIGGFTLLINIIALSMPLIIMICYDKLIGAQFVGIFLSIVTGVVILSVFDYVFKLGRSKMLAHILNDMHDQTNDQLLETILFSTQTANNPNKKKLLAICTGKNNSIFKILNAKQIGQLIDFPFILLFLLMILLMSGWMIIAPIIAIILMCMAHSVAQKIKRNRANEQQHTQELSNGKVSFFTQYIADFRLFSNKKSVYNNYRCANKINHKIKMDEALLENIKSNILYGIMMTTGVVTIASSIGLVLSGQLSLGGLIAIILFIWKILSPLIMLFTIYPSLKVASENISYIDKILATQEKEYTQKFVTIPKHFDSISIENLNFRYHGKENYTLSNINFSLTNNEFIILTGINGSGKTTLVKLLIRHLDSGFGDIYLGPYNIKQFNPNEISKIIGYIPQKHSFLPISILDNFRSYRPSLTEEDIVDLAQELGFYEQIKLLPQGLDTIINHSNSDLFNNSMLIKLSFLRALINNPKIIIIDEITNEIDYESEFILLGLFNKIRHKKFIIYVTHRQAHFALADRVMVLNNGVIDYFDKPPSVNHAEKET